MRTPIKHFFHRHACGQTGGNVEEWHAKHEIVGGRVGLDVGGWSSTELETLLSVLFVPLSNLGFGQPHAIC